MVVKLNVKTIRDFDFNNKKVLLRIDMDVPLDNGVIVDDTRLRASLDSINYLLDNGASVIFLLGHIGRPGGKPVPELSTKVVADWFSSHLSVPVAHVDSCFDFSLPDARVVVLENVRFFQGEKANDPVFSEKLASLADLYVNDAFATCHRSHASMVGVPSFIPGCLGFNVLKELENLSLDDAEKPFIAVLGGAKLSTKLPVIINLSSKVDYLLVGGAMIFTFYKALGFSVGDSLVDDDFIAKAKSLLDDPVISKKIVLPSDVVVSSFDEFSSSFSNTRVVSYDSIPDGFKGLDIGPEAVNKFKSLLSFAKTIVWNGPLGYVEAEPFDKATVSIAEFIASLTNNGVRTVVGGGDSLKVVNKLGLASAFTHVSTGGGASLLLLQGSELVALKALEKWN